MKSPDEACLIRRYEATELKHELAEEICLNRKTGETEMTFFYTSNPEKFKEKSRLIPDGGNTLIETKLYYAYGDAIE